MENGTDQVPSDEVSSWGVPSFAERAQDIERQLKCELPWSELLVCIHWSDTLKHAPASSERERRAHKP